METWVKDFEFWDISDQACGNLFGNTLGWEKARNNPYGTLDLNKEQALL